MLAKPLRDVGALLGEPQLFRVGHLVAGPRSRFAHPLHPGPALVKALRIEELGIECLDRDATAPGGQLLDALEQTILRVGG